VEPTPDKPQPLQFDIRRILAALPHRYPFLLVDRVLELVPGERLHAIKNVTFNENFFQGHFPGQPVMPGVLQLEALAQAGALLAHHIAPFDPEKKVIFLMSFDKAKFRRVVRPGDQLHLRVVLEKHRGNIFRIAGEARVDDQVASEALMLATLADKPEW
jgi:3-hydroxyacyl-[acyl-carrier-protein] dehydratase